MKPSHLYYKDVNRKDGAYYRRWASAYGEYTAELIDNVLRSARHEEQAFNSCAGILHMCKGIPMGLSKKLPANVSRPIPAGIPISKKSLQK